MKTINKSKIIKILNFNLKLIVLSSLLFSQLSLSEIFLYQNNQNDIQTNIVKADFFSPWVVGVGGDSWGQNSTMSNVSEDLGGHDAKLGIFADNFDDNTEDWTESGTGFSATAESGKYKTTLISNLTGYAFPNLGDSTNYSLFYTYNYSAGSAGLELGFAHRYNSTTPTYYFFEDRTWNADLRILNIATELNKVNFDTSAGQDYQVKDVCSGNILQHWVDGAIKNNTTNSAYTTGKFGFSMKKTGGSNTNVYIDNVRAVASDGSNNPITTGTILSNPQDSLHRDAGTYGNTGYVWKQIGFSGSVNAGTSSVNVEIDTSSDNLSWDGWTTIQDNAAPGTVYDIPTARQKKYGKWRLTLNTTDVSQTPSVQAVTFTPGVPPNTVPTVAAPTISQVADGSGYINLQTILDDNDNNGLKLKVEYSIDNGGTWYDPYILSSYISTSPSQVTQPDIDNSAIYQIGDLNPILTSSGANTVSFRWDSRNVLNELGAVTTQAQVKIRLTPFDSTDTGTPVLSSAFTVDNTPPSSFSLSSPFDSISSTNPIFSWNASSDTSGLFKYQLYIDGVSDRDNIADTDTSTSSASSLICGNHTWYVKASDTLANSTYSNTLSFTVSCGGVFVSPVKPDIAAITSALLSASPNLDALLSDIIQIAISYNSDFKDVSWQTFDKDEFKSINQTKETLYIKLRTREGAVSDTFVFEGNVYLNTSLVVLQEGDIMKTFSNPDVYIVKYKNNKQYKRLILSPQVFSSYQHLNWSNLKIVTQGQLDAYIASNIVQVKDDTNIYELFSDGDMGNKQILDTAKTYDQDSVYEINEVDRDSYISK